jgi:hypothetical protein
MNNVRGEMEFIGSILAQIEAPFGIQNILAGPELLYFQPCKSTLIHTMLLAPNIPAILGRDSAGRLNFF